jgi:hypothetical protein
MRVDASAAQQPLRHSSAGLRAAAGKGRQQGAAQPPAPKPRSPLRKMPTPPRSAGLAWEPQRQLCGPSAQCLSGPAAGAAVSADDQHAAAAEHAVFQRQGCSSSCAAAPDSTQASSMDQPTALSGSDEAAGTSSPVNAVPCDPAPAAAAAAPAGPAASALPACHACCDVASLQREVLDLKEQVSSITDQLLQGTLLRHSGYV